MYSLTWLRLFRWLGPWASLDRMPPAHRESHRLDLGEGRESMEWVSWAPTGGRVRGSLFMIPGLHFQGPGHPRMERLARICAHAGLLVGAPALPDFLQMRVRPDSCSDAMAAFSAFRAHPQMPQTRTGLMSVSFGAYPAVHVATSQAWRDRVGGVLTFGGYLNWKAPIRYSWDNGPGVPFDARNNPVAYTFLLNQLPQVPNPDAVLAAWDAYIRQTWGVDEMRPEAPRRQLAESLGSALEAADRRLFMQGCRMEEGALEQLEASLEVADDQDWLEIGPMLDGLRSPLLAVHSMDDEISPPEQSRALVEACPSHVDARLFLTGLYGHSGQHAGGETGLGAMFRELRVFGRIVSGLVEISTRKIDSE